jgi:hypothetical protein
VSDCNEKHSANSQSSKQASFESPAKATVARSVQSWKHPGQIVSTADGMQIDFSDLHEQNASPSMQRSFDIDPSWTPQIYPQWPKEKMPECFNLVWNSDAAALIAVNLPEETSGKAGSINHFHRSGKRNRSELQAVSEGQALNLTKSRSGFKHDGMKVTATQDVLSVDEPVGPYEFNRRWNANEYECDAPSKSILLKSKQATARVKRDRFGRAHTAEERSTMSTKGLDDT